MGLWVGTESTPLPDGSAGGFIAVVHYGDDVSWPLPGDLADRYAATLAEAAMRAAYDAAFCNQWKFGLKHPDADELMRATLTHDLVPDRRPLDDEATGPIRFQPALTMNKDTGRMTGRVRIFVNGEDVGTWDIAEARRHAWDAVAVRRVSELDQAYWRFLHKTCGVGDNKARGIIYYLGLWLDTGEPEPTAQRLARDLYEAGAEPDLVDRARDGEFDEYQSQVHEAPLMALLTEARAAGLNGIADRVLDGAYDATREEGREWTRSGEGQAAFAALLRDVEKAAGTRGPATAAAPRPGVKPNRADRRRKRKK